MTTQNQKAFLTVEEFKNFIAHLESDNFTLWNSLISPYSVYFKYVCELEPGYFLHELSTFQIFAAGKMEAILNIAKTLSK
jgi:hypothetical protein